MNVVHAMQPFPDRVTKTLFLAGPTPRGRHPEGWLPLGEVTWRTEALRLLENEGYDGHVFVPEPANEAWAEDYSAQIEWEADGLRRADVILFWVPRDVHGRNPEGNGMPMPAFTTNDEWGQWKASGKVVFGAPAWADHTRYQKHYADKLGVRRFSTLEDTVDGALEMIGEGEEREGVAASVPLHIWKQPNFRAWWGSQTLVGNEIRHVDVAWTSGKRTKHSFFVVHPVVWIKAEDREKSNEVVIIRPDISTVCLYHRGMGDTKVVLIKEFRTAVQNHESYVYEIPGGSSLKQDEDVLQTAAKEVSEELGVEMAPQRLKAHGSRQVGSTLCGYHAHLFSAELTDEELARFEADTRVHGDHENDERTYVVVRSVREVIDDGLVDWPHVGMILQALYAE